MPDFRPGGSVRRPFQRPVARIFHWRAIMMVRVIDTGTGDVKSAIAYLMGKYDHPGRLRAVEPEACHAL